MSRDVIRKIIFFFTLNFFIWLSYIPLSQAKIYDYDIPNNLKIVFTPSSYKKYQNLLTEAMNSPIWNITSKFKTNLKIQGSYTDQNGVTHLFSGNGRITGDLKDHLKIDENRSSLSVSLDKGNLGGIVRFRLVLPESKKFGNEVLWSILMEELGFIAPANRYIHVGIMGASPKLYLIEEKPSKEFLESNGRRESPILEFDESEFWENAILDGRVSESIKTNWPNYLQAKIINQNFIKNKVSSEIAYRSLYFGAVRDRVHFIDFPHKNNSINNFERLNKKWAEHGLAWTNRKFIYDAIYNDYMPVYYDGNIGLRKQICNEASKRDGIGSISVNNKTRARVAVVKSKFLSRTLGLEKFSKKHECMSAIILQQDIGFYQGLIKIKPLKAINYPIHDLVKKTLETRENALIKHPVYTYNPSSEIMDLCQFNDKTNSWSNCESKSSQKLKKVLGGGIKPMVINNYSYYPIIPITYRPMKKETIKKINLKKESVEFKVKKNETLFLEADTTDASIDVTLADTSSFVVFHNSELVNTKINVNSQGKLKLNNEVRYNERLLTACLTFVDTKLTNSSITSSDCLKEDGVNFIRVNGNLINVDVANAAFDALDADFSDITFTSINVNGAGNDCIDVSGGVYNFNSVILKKCGDKAISAGERSLVAVGQAMIEDTLIGIASKDQTDVHISNKIIFSNVKTCLAAYQKKQEFSASKINVSPNFPKCKTLEVKPSHISIDETCRKVSRNYYFNVCLKEDMALVQVRNNIPENTSLFFVNNSLKSKKVTDNNETRKFFACKAKNCKFGLNITNAKNGFEIGLYNNFFKHDYVEFKQKFEN